LHSEEDRFVGRRGVGVEALREAAVSGLDLGRGGVAVDAEHAVGVGDALHRRSPQATGG
jgi:hypothetical protein